MLIVPEMPPCLCHPERSAWKIWLPTESLARSRRIPRICFREFLPKRQSVHATSLDPLFLLDRSSPCRPMLDSGNRTGSSKLKRWPGQGAGGTPYGSMAGATSSGSFDSAPITFFRRQLVAALRSGWHSVGWLVQFMQDVRDHHSWSGPIIADTRDTKALHYPQGKQGFF